MGDTLVSIRILHMTEVYKGSDGHDYLSLVTTPDPSLVLCSRSYRDTLCDGGPSVSLIRN